MADMSEIENLLRNDPELLPKVQSILNRRRQAEQQERRDRRRSRRQDRRQESECAQWTSNIDCESPSTNGECTWNTSLQLCVSTEAACPGIGFQECIRSQTCEWKDGACAPKTFLMDES